MIIDIIVLVVLFISSVIAFLRGFIREVLTIAGVVGGLAAAYFIGPSFAPVMRGWFGVEEGIEPERLFGILPYNILADGLAYAVIFVVMVGALSVISHMMAETARNLGLGAIDRTLGVIFGLVRGILLLSILYLPVHLMLDQKTTDEFFAESRTHVYIEKTAIWLSDFLPAGEDDRNDINRVIDEKKEQVSSTREKLESLDLLQKEIKKIDGQISDTIDESGYEDTIRGEMDKLFETTEE